MGILTVLYEKTLWKDNVKRVDSELVYADTIIDFGIGKEIKDGLINPSLNRRNYVCRNN